MFRLREVSFAYDRVQALAGLSLEVRRGERLALLGANGSGKSTLLRLLAGLTFATRGSVEFDGQTLTAERLEEAKFFYDFRRRVGVVFQNPEVQLFNASVFDEVAFGPLQLGWAKAEIRERVERILEEMQLSGLRERPPHRLSGGEKKRVALASVLVTEPEVLLLDEPVAALDPASQNGIIELLESWGGGARTVVMATHDLSALESIADRCVVLERGRVAADSGPLAILHDLALLERTNLLRPHRHRHRQRPVEPHGHLHAADIPGAEEFS